jgi:hypothetical protein
MTAPEIAAVLGGRRRGGDGWWSCCCPTHDDRAPSLSLRDGDRGLIVHCHAGCEPRDVLAELRRRGLVTGRVEHRPSPAPLIRAEDHSARRIAIARRIWDEARDARGTSAEGYLAGRGTSIAPPASLRYAPSLWRRDGPAGPAMVARIDGPGGEFWGVHRTWLSCDAAGVWRRRDRAMLGRAAGGAVRLAPAAETLLVGEGIETTLAGMLASGWPGWAALSISGFVALILPPIICSVIVLADHDISGAGEWAARTAAARWLVEGRQVQIYMSPRVGEDAADLILAAAIGARDAA